MALVLAFARSGGVPEDSNHIFFSCVSAQFVWSCFREVVGGNWCHTNFPDLFAELQNSPCPLATLGGLRLGSSPGPSGRFAISL